MSDSSPAHPHEHNMNQLFRYAEFLGFGDIHFKVDEKTGLLAIVAIHNTQRGPGLGGCRLLPYPTIEEAMTDALRLAQMMTLKAAACELPLGGAKSVLVAPKHMKDRKAYFEVFGDFINDLGGRYIVAVDSGTEPSDMDIIATRTSYVSSTTRDGDPSPHTAHGVFRGIEAAVKFKLDQGDLSHTRVAIQGAGHVGYHLAQKLTAAGAKVLQTDTNPDKLQRCVDEFGVAPVETDKIYSVECDVFAPCAMGGTLNTDTIKRLKATIVAGSANNQLAHHHNSSLMHERGILYAPDFVINSGGLIYAATIYKGLNKEKALAQIDQLYDTLWKIFERSKLENRPTNEIAEMIAYENLK